MKATVKHLVKKVTLELVYDVVDERTRELRQEMKEMREDIKAVNTRIDQIHMRLDQMIHMLADIKSR
jgi:DNA anti-recombination protein RmuC